MSFGEYFVNVFEVDELTTFDREFNKKLIGNVERQQMIIEKICKKYPNDDIMTKLNRFNRQSYFENLAFPEPCIESGEVLKYMLDKWQHKKDFKKDIFDDMDKQKPQYWINMKKFIPKDRNIFINLVKDLSKKYEILIGLLY